LALLQSGQYLADWLEWEHQQRKEQELNPPPGIVRLRQLKAVVKTQTA
jgi:hypothetical protein